MRQCPVCKASTRLFTRVGDRDFPDRSDWEIWQCTNCGYGFTQPDISDQQLQAYYPEAYLGDTVSTLDAFLDRSVQKTRSWRRETEKAALVERFCQSGRILDVGASNASFLLALDPSRWERVGVERIRPVVEVVRAKVSDLELHCGDCYAPALSPGTFDVVTFWHVLEHLHEPRRVLQRVAQLLKPGGIVVISVPHFASYQARLFRRHWYAFDVPRHLHHFSSRSLELLLDESGFDVLQYLFFSRLYNIHQLKYSLLDWSLEHFHSRAPYYLLKPALFLFQGLEGLTRHYGSLTTVARLT